MKRVFISVMLAWTFLFMQAQESGIQFFHGTFDEAVAKAQQENKKVFIDFFTEWCGPCLNMALKVFPLPQVGEVYNKNFVCVKIDAEKGEGIELARKYGVRSYPSYIFVEPSTREMIHRSGSNKPAKDFMADAQGALNPKLSSLYLAEKYASGDYDSNFLMDYIRGQKISGNRDIEKDFDHLLQMGNSLTDPEVWNLFVECINGYNNPYLKQVSDQYEKFCQLFGKEAVDSKLKQMTAYAPEETIRPLCDFNGKDYNIKMARMNQLFRQKKYDEAWDYVDTLIADTTVNQQDFVRQLAFNVRVYNDDNLNFEQLVKKVRHTRYVAYNMYDRDDASVHFYYASALEYLIKRAGQEGKTIPQDLIATPKYGKQTYDMRHPSLKSKPRR